MLYLVNGRRCGRVPIGTLVFLLEGGSVLDRVDTGTLILGRVLHPTHVVDAGSGVSLYIIDCAARVYHGRDCDGQTGVLYNEFYVRQAALLRGGPCEDYGRKRGRVRGYYWQGVHYTRDAWRVYWSELYVQCVKEHPLLRRVAGLACSTNVYIPCLLRLDGALGKQVRVTATRQIVHSLETGSVVRTHRDRWRHELVIARLLVGMAGLP